LNSIRDIADIPLSKKQRSGHLNIFLDDLAHKLESGTLTQPEEKEEPESIEKIVSGGDIPSLNW
jgi:hypothetical protein